MEFGESEGEDDGEDGSTEITEEEWHEGWYRPVLALANDDVQVATELVTLPYLLVDWSTRVVQLLRLTE